MAFTCTGIPVQVVVLAEPYLDSAYIRQVRDDLRD